MAQQARLEADMNRSVGRDQKDVQHTIHETWCLRPIDHSERRRPTARELNEYARAARRANSSSDEHRKPTIAGYHKWCAEHRLASTLLQQSYEAEVQKDYISLDDKGRGGDGDRDGDVEVDVGSVLTGIVSCDRPDCGGHTAKFCSECGKRSMSCFTASGGGSGKRLKLGDGAGSEGGGFGIGETAEAVATSSAGTG